MRSTVVYCHPCEGSLAAATRDVVLDVLAGSPVDLIDLSSPNRDTPSLADTASLDGSDLLVLVYPTWWSGPPGALQEWFDEVWPGDARFDSIRSIVVCTSHGSSKLVNALEGESGRLMARRYLRRRAGRRCRVSWVALYGLDRCGPDRRQRHLERVRRAISAARP